MDVIARRREERERPIIWALGDYKQHHGLFQSPEFAGKDRSADRICIDLDVLK